MQKVVEFLPSILVVINQERCLHCGRCAGICPKQCIKKRG